MMISSTATAAASNAAYGTTLQDEFVLPIPLCSKVHDLCQKIESRVLTKLPEQAQVNCQSVFMLNSDHAVMLEDECQNEEKLDHWFQRQYQIENDQTVSMCFRDFDKIACRLTINQQEFGQNYQHTPLITQSAPKPEDLDTNKRKQKQNVKESEQRTEPCTPTKKLSKNARKKMKRRQEEEEKENYEQKMSQLRELLRVSINGYSQEEASRGVSNSQEVIDQHSEKQQQSASDFYNENKEYSDIERVLRLNSQNSGKILSSGSECSCN